MRDFSILKQRILEYLDSEGISKYECYKNTGITNGVLSQQNGMSEDNIMKFLSYYKNINKEWLFSGDGEMIIQPENKKVMTVSTNDNDISERIPIVDISVAAGHGTFNNNFIEELDCISFPHSMLRNGRKYLCVRVKGPSMSPSILDGGYLIIYNLERQEWQDIRDNYVYVVSDNEGKAFVKRIKNRLKEHGFIVCMSDNSDKSNYPNFNIEEEQLNSVWYAEWYFTARIPNIQETYYHKQSELEDKLDELYNQMQKIQNRLSM